MAPEGEFRCVSAKESDAPPGLLVDLKEFRQWSFYRAILAEFVATLLFLYVTIAHVIGYAHSNVIGYAHSNVHSLCEGVARMGNAWAFGGMIFLLVYCTAGISGGHINPAVTFGLLLARKLSINRAVLYMVAQCVGAVCGVAMVKALQSSYYITGEGGANKVKHGYTQGTALIAGIIGTFVLVYTVFSATDPKLAARNSHIPVLAPLSIGFAVFVVHLATIPITGTGINPARSFGAAVVYGHKQLWEDHWIFWLGPFIGAAAAAVLHKAIAV
ncbi:hypothetical protein SUGI_1138710 [Cryptomeria japonica]|nr:hypothetical protein SUGI_1138710 [Cryptomeria japonica]